MRQHAINNCVVSNVLSTETLLGQDQQICSTLEEKLQLYAELTELSFGLGEPVTQRHLLASPETDAETPRQASTLLTAAVKEGEEGGKGGAS